MGDGELRCREVTEILDAYLDGTMATPERERLEAHLAACPGCVNYLDQLRATIRVTGALADDGLPAGTAGAVMEAFRAWRAGH